MKAGLRSASCAVLVSALLGACANHPPAPVDDRSGSLRTTSGSATAESRPGFYTVKKGDTLYSIALDNGQSYRDIAAWNNLENPNLIKVGQSLRVAQEDGAVVVKPIRNTDVVETAAVAPVRSNTNEAGLKREPLGGKQPYSEAAWAVAQRGNDAAVPAVAAPAAPAAPVAASPAPGPEKPAAAATAPAAESPTDWVWPTSGKVSSGFAEGSNKGVDIPAKAGQNVVAANSGTVTLVSNALRGYGNLVVIKHSQTLLSVYAHNSKIVVSEGQAVTKGQKIAEVGNSDSDAPKLHFEIRNMGKPVDPLKFLPSR